MIIKLNNLPYFQIASIVGVSLILGGAILLFSPLWVLAIIVAIYCFALLINRPEFALLSILTASSSIIFEDSLPLLHVGIGSLHVTDILLLGLFCWILIRRLVEPGFKIIRTPLDLPMLCFFGVAVFSTLLAILNGSVDRQLALRGTRVITYYLTFFIATNLIRKKGQLRFLIYGIVILGSIVALAMVTQYIVGDKVQLFPGRVEAMQTQNIAYSGVTRILPPGQSLVFLNFIILVTLLLVDKMHTRSIVWFLLTILFGIGVILTFNRNFWGGICIAIALLVILIRNTKFNRLSIWFIVIVVVLASTILLFNLTGFKVSSNSPITAVIYRFSTFFSSGTLNEESLRDRYYENSYAFSKIIQFPIIGIGLGTKYRPWDPNLDYGVMNGNHDLRNYIHNGHLGLILDTGFLGYACFLWLSVLFILRGLKFWNRIQDSQEQALFLAMVLAYIGIFAAAIVNPVFQQWFWTPVFGIMIGTNELLLRFAENSK